MDFSEEGCYSESESGSQFSDGSQDDPSFDVVERTRLTLSNLSLKGKSEIARTRGVDEEDGEEVEELDDKDKQSYEIIQKMIKGGQVDRLKVDQCKVYLRKHGLRLSGKKDVLIDRIKEHVDIVSGGGEEKYPPSSFVLNCKGDSCKGDVVMFEQNVYEEFSIVSRSSKGGPCGTRVVAGRIVNESYGAAKQQHTFTIEVLWSKGEKPLPPLHPLLIKGRNLYKMNTMRQKWEDEGERRRILSEKHARGGAARSNREARIQQKELRKTHRVARNEHPNREQQEEKHETRRLPSPPQHMRTEAFNIPVQPRHLHGNTNYAALEVHQRQPLMAVNCNYSQRVQIQYTGSHPSNPPQNFSSNPIHPQIPVQQHAYREIQRYSTSHSSHAHHTSVDTRGNRPIEQRQNCRYYVQGRCHFGDRCKFSHDLARNKWKVVEGRT